MLEEDYYEKYAVYEEQERPVRVKPRKNVGPNLAELADVTEQGGEFQTTYKPSRFEATWLLSSLSSFYQQGLIQDVLMHIKGGKEASVYLCAAQAVTGYAHLAAKVYRPRKFRNLRNDKMYQEGRPVLTADGNVAKKTDHRLMRALGKKTDFGQQVQHTSWLMYEFTTLQRLHQAGARVPEPIAASENAILMGYRGDAHRAAPTLIEVRLTPMEAKPLFQEAIRNIELMLQNGLIHGDLSAYNLLYWEGNITLIDFPQVTDSRGNRQAAFILQRDITRICDYFLQQGVCCDPEAIFRTLWNRYEKEYHDAQLLQEAFLLEAEGDS